MRLFIKYRSPAFIVLALILSLLSNVSFAALSCGSTATSGIGRCSQLAASGGFQSYYNTTPGTAPNTLNCVGYSWDYTRSSVIGSITCSGTCDNGVIPSNTTGYTCDLPLDNCSTSVSTLGADLSGSSTDGACGCPSGKEMVGAGTSSVSCQTPCVSPQTRDSSGVCASPPPPTCQGNLVLVNGACGCPAGSTLGTFNGVPTCASSSSGGGTGTSSGTKQGGGTATTTTTTNGSSVANSNGTTTTTTTINNTTVVGGASGGAVAGTDTISNGSSTMTVTTDGTGKVISSTGTSTTDKKQDSLTTPSNAPAHAALNTGGISGAISSAPIFASLGAAFSKFPTSGSCSIIQIPLFRGMSVEFKEQCHSFEAIRNYLTVFAMVVYGLLSYRVFMRSASGV